MSQSITLERKIDDVASKMLLLFEHMDAKFDLVFEILGTMQNRMDTLATKEELGAVAKKVDVIERVVTQTNRELRSHDKRMTKLEHKVFD